VVDIPKARASRGAPVTEVFLPPEDENNTPFLSTRGSAPEYEPPRAWVVRVSRLSTWRLRVSLWLLSVRSNQTLGLVVQSGISNFWKWHILLRKVAYLTSQSGISHFWKWHMPL